jgi:glycosyltransferase involved in cell wall biosynthesis
VRGRSQSDNVGREIDDPIVRVERPVMEGYANAQGSQRYTSAPLPVRFEHVFGDDSCLAAPMRRLRVMHVVVAGDIGGAERLLADLATRPGESGADHEVALITPNRALATHFSGLGFRVHDRGPARENALAYLYRSLGPVDVAWLTNLLAARTIDIVHTHTFASHVLGTRSARRARLPQIRTEHHVMHYFDPSTSPFTRWAAHRTDRFVAVSDYVRSVLERAAPAAAARTTVVRNGVDTQYWSPLAHSQGAFRLGIICRLTAWKRVHVAIEAATLANAELLVVGDGEKRATLEDLGKRLGARVHFVGHQRDPRPYIAECDVTLSTADNEPLGLSVLESLSMRRPVIAYAGGGIPEIVRDGETGWLVPEATAEAFAHAIDQARQNRGRLSAMGTLGRQFAVEHASLERMCEGYASVYRTLSVSRLPRRRASQWTAKLQASPERRCVCFRSRQSFGAGRRSCRSFWQPGSGEAQRPISTMSSPRISSLPARF